MYKLIKYFCICLLLMFGQHYPPTMNEEILGAVRPSIYYAHNRKIHQKYNKNP